jgi:hypothetical protein
MIETIQCKKFEVYVKLEDEGCMFLQNVGNHIQEDRISRHNRLKSTWSSMAKRNGKESVVTYLSVLFQHSSEESYKTHEDLRIL